MFGKLKFLQIQQSSPTVNITICFVFFYHWPLLMLTIYCWILIGSSAKIMLPLAWIPIEPVRNMAQTVSALSSAHRWMVGTIVVMIGVWSVWVWSRWEVFTLQRWVVTKLQQGELWSLALAIIMLSYMPPPPPPICTRYHAKPWHTIFPYAQLQGSTSARSVSCAPPNPSFSNYILYVHL